MHSETMTIIIPAPKSDVFKYIANPSNLPGWANEFCQDLKEENGIFTIVTPMGEMIFNIAANEETGVIDMYASPDGKSDFPLATRVLALPDGQTAYSVLFFQDPNISNDIYQQQLGSLRKEMDNVKSLFTQ